MYPTATRLRADILVTSDDGTTRLVIETKKNAGPEMAAAAQMMRDQVAAQAPESFFLFVSTRRFWLWAPSVAAPVYEADTSALLGRYINLDKVPLTTMGDREFNLLVYSWLGSVVFKPANVLQTLPGQEWLVGTGVHALIYRGYIHLETEVGQ